MNGDWGYGIGVREEVVVYAMQGDGKLGVAESKEFIGEGSGFEFLMGRMGGGWRGEEGVELGWEDWDRCGEGVMLYEVGYSVKMGECRREEEGF